MYIAIEGFFIGEIMKKKMNANEILSIIKNSYKNLEKGILAGLEVNAPTIAGYITHDYLDSQRDDDKYLARLSSDIIDNEQVNICVVKNLLVMSVGFNIPKDMRMKWLYSYIKRVKVERGIVISGFDWNMVVDGKEYDLNFKEEITVEEFKRFLI